MTELHDFIASVEAEEDDAERQAIADLEPLYNAHEAKRFYERDSRLYDPHASDYGKMGKVRRWLTDHAGEPLIDQELGIKAWLQPGGKSDRYEAVAVIHEQNPKLFERLLLLGCLSLDGGAIANAMRAGLLSKGDLEGYVFATERTSSLRIARTGE